MGCPYESICKHKDEVDSEVGWRKAQTPLGFTESSPEPLEYKECPGKPPKRKYKRKVHNPNFSGEPGDRSRLKGKGMDFESLGLSGREKPLVVPSKRGKGRTRKSSEGLTTNKIDIAKARQILYIRRNRKILSENQVSALNTTNNIPYKLLTEIQKNQILSVLEESSKGGPNAVRQET